MRLSRLILITVGIWLVLHANICALVYNLEPTRYPWGVESIFKFWDAKHYATIIVSGYDGGLWAFYPLYPLLLKAFSTLTGLRDSPEFAGAILSTLLFAAFCFIQSSLAEQHEENLRRLRPLSVGGWLMFLFSSASYIFHTNHTESLFLLLSFCAFWASRKGRWKTAALIAGLCALSRNQGVFVAVTVALDGALQREGWRKRLQVFAITGIISFLMFACYPLYQYYKTGDALRFLHIHSTNWHLITTFHQWIGTLWYFNPWQSPNWRDNLHLVLFFLFCAVAAYFLSKKEYPLALYTFLSTIIVLFQGELVNMFRYGSVLFPALFLMGDKAWQSPRLVRWSIFAAVIALNLLYTRNYALGEWTY